MKKICAVKNNRGQGLIEYIIIVAMIAVGTISLVRVLHQSVSVQFAHIAKALGAKSTGKVTPPEITSSMMQKKDLTNFMKGARSNNKDDNSSQENNENE